MAKCASTVSVGSDAPIPLRRGPTVDVSRELEELGDLSEAVFDALPFFFMLVDSRHTILFANRAVREALGDRARDIVGSYCPAVVHGLDQPFPGCPLEESVRENTIVERDFYETSSRAWVNSAIYPTSIRTTSGFPVYAHVVRDVSKRRTAQLAVREQAAMQQLISRLATHFLAARPGRIREATAEALRMVAEFMGCARYSEYLAGDSPTELVRTSVWQSPIEGHRLSDLPEVMTLEEVLRQPPLESNPEAASLPWEERAAEDGAAEHSVLVPISVGGSTVNGCVRFDQWAQTKSPRLRDAHLIKLLGTTLSVGLERLRSAQQLAHHAARLRSMALELTAAEERERRRIAADLHDQIGQTLALSLMKVSSLRSQAQTPGMSRALDEVHAHIKEALADAKSLMFELSPPVLHQFGLGAALEWLLEQFSTRHGLECTLSDAVGPTMLGDDQEMFLFRAVQELVANVQRHAKAKKVQVELERRDGWIEVRVVDDGVGMPPELIHRTSRPVPKGFGLFSIEERLAHLGGTLELGSQPGAGTMVTLRVKDERATEGGSS